MKRIIISLFLMLITGSLSAQNFQFHYDFSKDRKYVTTTLEMFKPDKYGSTFWFVDMDYNKKHNGYKSVSLSYWEIARYINLPLDKLTATVQYNDGTVAGAPLGPIWLFGVSYPIDFGFITLNTDLLYRIAYDSNAPDAQLTTVWFKNFFQGKLTFDGFLDFWTQDKSSGNEKQFVLLTEPQIWYNLGEHLSVGSEVEISRNFLSQKRVEVKPTIAMKWNF